MKSVAGKAGIRACWIWLLLAILVPVVFVVPHPANAQDSRNFLERLFAPIRKQPPPQRIEPRKQAPAPAKRKQVRRKPAASTATPARASKPSEPEKLENARIVLVIGDFTAGGLAEGLTSAFSEAPGVRIVQRANGSSGLVRDDYYDWFEALPKLIEEIQPSIVAIMIGANDRQQMRTTEPRLELRTEAWDKAYEARATKLAQIVRDREIPLIWIGQPPYSSSRMSTDMVAFNDVYRRVTEAANGVYVDIWDGFVDEAGAYVSSGPDMNGQPARLRASDGINITRAGRRKIAFYAEKPLRRLLGDVADPEITSLEPGGGLMLEPHAAPKIDRTAPMALSGPELDGGTDLLGAVFVLPQQSEAGESSKLIMDGNASPAPEGRADNFKQR